MTPPPATAEKMRKMAKAKKKPTTSSATRKKAAKPSTAKKKPTKPSTAKKKATKPSAAKGKPSARSSVKAKAATKKKVAKPGTAKARKSTDKPKNTATAAPKSIDDRVVEEFPLDSVANGNGEYEAKHIQVLKGLEAVRKRPAMYIGDTGRRGLHHLVYEVVDNSIDEAMAGFCNKIKVSINKDGSVTVEDNGRGIPVDKHPTQNKSALEVVMTVLHAGGKFDKSSYKVSGGLHGVGVSVVNALSERCIVEVCRDGIVYKQSYTRGKPDAKVKPIGKRKQSGNKTTFYPDSEIFEEMDFEFEIVTNRCRELAFLNAGLLIVVSDARADKKEECRFKDGLKEFVKHINENHSTIHSKVVHFERTRDETAVEVAFQYNDTYGSSIYSYANNINTVEGGTHITGIKHSG